MHGIIRPLNIFHKGWFTILQVFLIKFISISSKIRVIIKYLSAEQVYFEMRKYFLESFTAQKIKFSIKDFFSKCNQIHSKLRIWSHLLKKPLMENFIFCAVYMRTDHVWPNAYPLFYFILLWRLGSSGLTNWFKLITRCNNMLTNKKIRNQFLF